MADGSRPIVLRQLRQAFGPPEDRSISDADLLDRFLVARDEVAFELLVRRHERLVWGTCKRLLFDANDVEDAFQATFLILLRQATAIRQRISLASWLYKVAYRVSLRARASLAKRAALEQARAELRSEAGGGDPAVEAAWRDLKPMLDLAIQALPEKCREVVVLCYLEGKTYTEAAQLLGCPRGTISIRLTRARQKLHAQLSKQGLALPAALLATAHAAQATEATLPLGLVRSAMGLTTDPISPRVAALSKGVLQAMTFTKFQTVSALVLLFLGIACMGLGMSGAMGPKETSAEMPEPPAPARSVAVVPVAQAGAGQQAKPGKILVWRLTKYVFVTPDGKEDGELPGHPDKLILTEPALSPDGKHVAFTANENPPTDEEGNIRRHVFVRALDGQDPGFKLAINAFNITWTPDGKLVAVEPLIAKELKDRGFTTWLVDIATKQKTKLNLSPWTHAWQMTPDGKSFVAAQYDLEARQIHLVLISKDGKQTTKLTELQNEGPDPKISPDGKRILFMDFDANDKAEEKMPRLPRLFVYNLQANKRARLAGVGSNASIIGYCWSPDAKKLAYTWKRVEPGAPLAENTDNMNDPKLNTETESHLMVADADGSNAKTMMSLKAERSTTITIGGVDWR